MSNYKISKKISSVALAIGLPFLAAANLKAQEPTLSSLASWPLREHSLKPETLSQAPLPPGSPEWNKRDRETWERVENLIAKMEESVREYKIMQEYGSDEALDKSHNEKWKNLFSEWNETSEQRAGFLRKAEENGPDAMWRMQYVHAHPWYAEALILKYTRPRPASSQIGMYPMGAMRKAAEEIRQMPRDVKFAKHSFLQSMNLKQLAQLNNFNSEISRNTMFLNREYWLNQTRYNKCYKVDSDKFNCESNRQLEAESIDNRGTENPPTEKMRDLIGSIMKTLVMAVNTSVEHMDYIERRLSVYPNAEIIKHGFKEGLKDRLEVMGMYLELGGSSPDFSVLEKAGMSPETFNRLHIRIGMPPPFGRPVPTTNKVINREYTENLFIPGSTKLLKKPDQSQDPVP